MGTDLAGFLGNLTGGGMLLAEEQEGVDFFIHPSNNSMETYLTKVSSIIFFPLGFRFLILMILVCNLVNF